MSMKCIRCKKSSRDSGVPYLCNSCVHEMDKLAKRLSTYNTLINQWYILGWSREKMLKYIKKDAMKILKEIEKIENEEYKMS